MEERILPERLAHAIVVVTVNCRRCRYDLRGQRVDGRCPECGEQVYQSVVATLDPDSSRLPTLRDPGRVGDGIVWIVASLTLAIILSRVRPMTLWLDALDPTSTGRLAMLTPAWIFITSPLALIGGLWGVHLLMPRSTSAENASVKRDLGLMRLGLIAMAIGLTIVTWPGMRPSPLTADLLVLLAAQTGLAAATILVLIGLHRTLRAIGRRSRTYRRARGGKQSINALAAAVVSIWIGRMFEFVTPGIPLFGGAWREWHSIGAAIVSIAYVMLLIGLAYLLVNMFWIRQSLRQAPPTLDEILLPPLPADTTIIGPDIDEPFTVRIKTEDGDKKQ